MASGDFIGKTKAMILGFLTNLANNGLAFAIPLGLTSETFPAYVAAVAAAVDAQTAADEATAAAVAATALANGQIDALVTQTRAMAASARTSSMSDADLAMLGIARRSPTNSRIPAPVDAPALALGSLSSGQAVLTYSTPGSAGPRTKPFGAVGVEISLRPISSIQAAETGILQTISKTPSPINTALLPAGTLKACGRFVTQRGLKGPWSAEITFTSQPV